MSSGKQHLVKGALVGAALDVIKQLWQMNADPTRQFNWLELGAFVSAGAAVAVLPDIIEPATSPHHRQFFHSVTWGSAVWFAAHGPHTEKWTGDERSGASILCYCYLSHLVDDAKTPMGIRMM